MEMTETWSLCETHGGVYGGAQMWVRGSHMQLLHMFRRCSPQMEKEKDWACGTSMCKCSTSACMYLLLSYMEYHVERVRMFIHAETNTLCEICTNPLWPCWFFQFGSTMTLLYSHMALLRLRLSEEQLKALHSATQGLFGKVNKKPPPPLNVQLPVLSESSMSTLECLTSWDMVKRKPPGTTGGPATAQHLHHVGWMCTHRKRGISARSFFNLHWQTWSSLLILGLLCMPK